MISHIRKWFAKEKPPAQECAECERLNREEAEASITLVSADVSGITDEARRMAAESRWRAAREQLAAHKTLNHPQDHANDLRKTAAKKPSPGSRPGSLCIVSTTVAPDIATTS